VHALASSITNLSPLVTDALSMSASVAAGLPPGLMPQAGIMVGGGGGDAAKRSNGGGVNKRGGKGGANRDLKKTRR
jgi:hypothetical protein